jgi:NCAIR mutase (PurE)-related protein
MLRGESVDLNQVLSSMHFVHLDEERKGRMGSAEIVFTVAESKRHIRTGAEWSAAYRRMSKGIVFLFPHRREELLEYAEHIESLFSAKHTNTHSKVILYDQSVRNQVGGGQNILLTDYHRFHSLSEAILHADGVEYKGHGKGGSKGGEGSSKGESSKKD